MNKAAIKNFAVWARVQLIEAVRQRAYEYEITEDGENKPSVEAIGGRPLSREEKEQRRQLIWQIEQNGYAQVMEEAAYTWFNRFIALRFMEVNGYLPSRIRVFTDENGAFKPEILKEAMSVELDGLDRGKVLELLDKQNNEALYKYLLIAQCNALNGGLPDMFEKIANWTELLFPGNLLRSDSVIGRLISDIPEADWTDQVQIIGWLYQYYNTAPKDAVFAGLKKNIKISKENIPAATQLFTPDWIVRYMVENSLGRLWVEGHPNDSLKANWKYYLEEAEQEECVKAQLEKLRLEYGKLQPEEIKVIDPCMGSGHILVYLFDVLMQIYDSCGYSARDAVRSILENNLYGLDIDRRAAQLAYFSVMMKAVSYDSRFLRRADIPQPNIYSPKGYEEGEEFGSLLMVDKLEPKPEQPDELTLFDERYEDRLARWNFRRLLAQKYDVVVTNPPYMAVSNASVKLQEYVKKNFPDSKADLFAAFIERCGALIDENGYQAMITQHAWMFLSSFEKLREKLQRIDTVNMAHLGARAFEEIAGEVVQTTSFVLRKSHIKSYQGTYCRLIEPTTQQGKEDMFLSGENRYTAQQDNFSKIPGSPVAYWVSERFIETFEKGISIDSISDFTGSQHITADNNKYLRMFWEVSNGKVGKGKTWAFYAKGGEYRKWYGNYELIIKCDPIAMQFYCTNPTSNCLAEKYWFIPGITYSAVTSKGTGFRFYPPIGAFDKGGATICFVNRLAYILALMNACTSKYIFDFLNPTINLQIKDVKALPIIFSDIYEEKVEKLANRNIELSKSDWDTYETSWDFKKHPLV